MNITTIWNISKSFSQWRIFITVKIHQLKTENAILEYNAQCLQIISSYPHNDGNYCISISLLCLSVRRMSRYETTYLIIAKLIFLFGEPLLRSHPLKLSKLRLQKYQKISNTS